MNRAVILALILVLVSSNCGSAGPNRAVLYDQYVAQLTEQRDSGQITSVERAQRMRQAASAYLGPEDAYGQEYWTYYIYIASLRDRGMSKEEAEYLVTKKLNELQARQRADYARYLQQQQQILKNVPAGDTGYKFYA